jgi:hypothetical protein
MKGFRAFGFAKLLLEQFVDEVESTVITDAYVLPLYDCFLALS